MIACVALLAGIFAWLAFLLASPEPFAATLRRAGTVPTRLLAGNAGVNWADFAYEGR